MLVLLEERGGNNDTFIPNSLHSLLAMEAVCWFCIFTHGWDAFATIDYCMVDTQNLTTIARSYEGNASYNHVDFMEGEKVI
uniref:Putative ovule protein n=1 Tax=Solanum chacoense TaxID=4108 RepID=A0A0V0H0F8_SOLCH